MSSNSDPPERIAELEAEVTALIQEKSELREELDSALAAKEEAVKAAEVLRLTLGPDQGKLQSSLGELGDHRVEDSYKPVLSRGTSVARK